MSTLAVVEEILRETRVPMSVRQIVEHARGRLPTRSKTPDTVVARDLSMDIKKKGEESLFIRTSPGRYTLRAIHLANTGAPTAGDDQAPVLSGAAPPVTDDHAAPPPDATREPDAVLDTGATPVLASAMRAERAGTLPARQPRHIESTQHSSTK